MRGLEALLSVIAVMFSAYAGYAAWPWWWFVISSVAVVLFWGIVLQVTDNSARRFIGMPTQSLSQFFHMAAGGVLESLIKAILVNGLIYAAAYWISN